MTVSCRGYTPNVSWAKYVPKVKLKLFQFQKLLLHSRKLTAGGPQNDGPWKRWFLLDMAIFGINSLNFFGVPSTGTYYNRPCWGEVGREEFPPKAVWGL